MQPSQAAIDLVKQFEGCRLKAYLCPAGKWTLGYGHTSGVKCGQECTREQADEWLAADLAEAARGLEARQGPLPQNQFDALVSFVFNLGLQAFLMSTLRRKLTAGDVQGAADEFSRWNHARGEVLPGLTARRAAERALFLG